MCLDVKVNRFSNLWNVTEIQSEICCYKSRSRQLPYLSRFLETLFWVLPFYRFTNWSAWYGIGKLWYRQDLPSDVFDKISILHEFFWWMAFPRNKEPNSFFMLFFHKPEWFGQITIIRDDNGTIILSSQASFKTWTARLTSEPFSSVLMISTKRFFPVGLANGAETVWLRKWDHNKLRVQGYTFE